MHWLKCCLFAERPDADTRKESVVAEPRQEPDAPQQQMIEEQDNSITNAVGGVVAEMPADVAAESPEPDAASDEEAATASAEESPEQETRAEAGDQDSPQPEDLEEGDTVNDATTTPEVAANPSGAIIACP